MKKLILISIILFLCSLKAQDGFQFAQTVTVDNGVGTHYDLTFGFSPDYTDGFEEGYCSDGLDYINSLSCEGGYCVNDDGIEQPEIETEQACIDADYVWSPPTGNTFTFMDIQAPPAPPVGFDAALYTDQRYYTQIVAGLSEDVSVEHVWNIKLLYADNNIINITFFPTTF